MQQPLKSKEILLVNNNNDTYYSVCKCDSYNLFLNMIIGGRGIGKTTSLLIKACTRAINFGKQFIYLRRYKPELKEFATKRTLDTIVKNGVLYKSDGTGGYIFMYDKHIIGYGITLSTARSYKSVAFPDVENIIYDEFTLPRGHTYHYLKDEVEEFLNFISTVFRTRTNGKVYMAGNNEDLFNPYFAYFNVPSFNKIYIDRDRQLYCELAKNSPKLIEMEKKTSLYALTNGTNFGNFHYNNDILIASKINVIQKPSYPRLYCRIKMNENLINVYMYNDSLGNLELYCECKDKNIPDDDITYIITNNGKPNYYYIDIFKKRIKPFMYKMFYNGKISYNDKKCGQYISWLMEQI